MKWNFVRISRLEITKLGNVILLGLEDLKLFNFLLQMIKNVKLISWYGLCILIIEPLRLDLLLVLGCFYAGFKVKSLMPGC